jgi:glycosyltransferase involved in cell wall biosynthesis
MRGPLVSVVIPTLNNARTIGATLLSTINQNYRSLEVIIVDDGSEDDTQAIVEGFKDRRIRYERLPTNRGISAALNKGIELASGDILARMDADDVMMPYRLYDQVARMLQYDIAIVGGGAEKFGAEGGEMRGPRSGKNIIDGFLVKNPFIHPSVIIDRRKIDVNYREDFVCEEDYELWSRCITSENCENLDYSMIKYRVSPTSNGNRLGKRKLTTQVLEQFCARLQLTDVPIAALVELQLSGLIRYEDYILLRDYAHRTARTGEPTLGWLQQPLLNRRSYRQFTNWFMRIVGWRYSA